MSWLFALAFGQWKEAASLPRDQGISHTRYMLNGAQAVRLSSILDRFSFACGVQNRRAGSAPVLQHAISIVRTRRI